jgi:hypothetical protein
VVFGGEAVNTGDLCNSSNMDGLEKWEHLGYKHLSQVITFYSDPLVIARVIFLFFTVIAVVG